MSADPSPKPLSIRRATVADAPSYARIMGHPDVLPNLMQVPYTSDDLWRQRLESSLELGTSDMLLVAERADPSGQTAVVGMGALHSPGQMLRRRHCMHLGIAIAPEAQGQGVGKALMQALCDWADRWGQVLRIELNVYADNARAIGLYRQLGFEHEGTHRAYALRDGAYVDSLSMARLHPRPPVLNLSTMPA